ncbi:unnamed protein product [Alopecurus aequalis]
MPLFDRDRYQRLPLDVSGGGAARRPASSCANATIILFVGLCIIGAWMMASTTMSVSPENKAEEDGSVDLTHSVINGDGSDSDTLQTTQNAGKVDDDGPGDATRTSDAAARDTVKKDGERQQGEGGGDSITPQTAENTGKENDDGPDDTIRTDTGKKDEDGGAVQMTEAAVVVAEPTDAAANGTTGGRPDGNTVTGAGELVSKNLTFSDENGMTEDGDVARSDDTDKKEQNSTDEATTSVQTDKKAEDAAAGTDKKGGNTAEQNKEEAPRDTTNTGDQVDKSSDKASLDTAETSGQDEKNSEAAPAEKKETDGQADNITGKSAEETPAYAKDAGDDGMAKNQTAFDDQNGNLDGDQNGDRVTGDDTAASNNQTTLEQNDAPNKTFVAPDDTISQEAEMVPTNSSSTTTEGEEKPLTEPVTGGDTEADELLPSGQAELLNETTTTAAQDGTFLTQATESSEEKKKARTRSSNKNNKNGGVVVGETSTEESSYVWKLCNASTGADYIPCLDNEAAIKRLRSTKHYEHRERHCPSPAPSCLVPLPEGYRRPIPWPNSRDRIWYNNVPHTQLASYKGHQNWVKVSGEHLVFPGGGTQFLNGASHYIDVIQEALPAVAWGTRSRVVLDVGCGVASFGGYLFDKDALTMSFAPKDEHEAQVQFALERGIPAISAVMGTKRLPYPGGAFDVVHCARCRVPWHIEGGKLLLELNRLLRPGGLFVWSATPVYRKDEENVGIWQAMAALTKSMCWEMVNRTSDTVDQTALVIFKKPSSNDCYGKRNHPEPPLCEETDNPNAARNITLQSCMHRLPTDSASRWPEQWPERLTTAPYWLGESQVGVYGNPAPEDFAADMEHWRKAVNSSYLTGMGIDWSNVRNIMDMRSVYGGFAAALRDMKVWVMNIVPVDSPDTLPIIYERGLLGMYHDWCESFSTYPRSYDLVHADHLFSKLKDRCNLRPVIAEVDRILRPEGKMIVREDRETAEEVQRIAKSLHWEVRMDVSREGEKLLCFEKTMWRPTQVEALS